MDKQWCAFPCWFENFRRFTLKSEIIPLPQEFVDYLGQDGIFISKDSFAKYREVDEYDESDEWNAREEDEDNEDEEIKAPSFPALEAQIQSSISRLGGCVFPKLNWSSPQDSVWMSSFGTLKCSTPSDIFLLLKSSDLIQSDIETCSTLSTSLSSPNQLSLVLRKWYDLEHSMEFRCFVRDHFLVGISQRNVSDFFVFLPPMVDDLKKLIVEFYLDNIRGKLPVSSFVFDVYISKQQRVWLLDFGLFDVASCDSSLFDYDELQTSENNEPDSHTTTSENNTSEDSTPQNNITHNNDRDNNNNNNNDENNNTLIYDPLLNFAVPFRVVQSPHGVIVPNRMRFGLPLDMIGGKNSALDDMIHQMREIAREELKQDDVIKGR